MSQTQQCVPSEDPYSERKGDPCTLCQDPCERYQESQPRIVRYQGPFEPEPCDLPKLDRFPPCKPTPEGFGPGGVPKGARTSDYYQTKNIPEKFEYPDCFKGYSAEPVHPLYRTTNADYGSRAPNVHTMPLLYAANDSSFTNHLGVCGMYRNRSLNCEMDKSRVPDN